MYRILLEITHKTKNQENQNFNEEKSTEAKTKINQMLELSDKELKAVIVKEFQN